MSRKLLITSVGCGYAPDEEFVPINKVSLEWLFRKGATLLWAETLYMTERDFRNVHELDFFPTEIEKEAARRFFDRLAAEGIVTIFNHGKYLPKITRASIQEQVECDEERFGTDCRRLKGNKKRDQCTIAIGEHKYCQPVLRGIYSSLTIARFLGGSCLFDSAELQFCEDRFAELQNPGREVEAKAQVFSDVYDVLVPSLDIINDFHLFCPPGLRECKLIKQCIANTPASLTQLENTILAVRSRPEVMKLAHYVDRLYTEVGPNEDKIWGAIRKDIAKQQKAMFAGFPKAKAWTSILEKTSSLVALFAVSKGEALLALSAGAFAGVASLAGIAVDLLTARIPWLATFVTKADPKQLGPRKARE